MTHQEAIDIAGILIKTYFPELTGKRIGYRFVKGKKYDYYMMVRLGLWSYRISIEANSLRFSPEAFAGCMAHELAHIVLDRRQSFFTDFFHFFGSRLSDTEIERAADGLVVEKGLGDALLRFHKEHEKDYKKYKASEGLTKREVKELMRKGQ